MITLPLAVDIADTSLRGDFCNDRNALSAAVDELRTRHPESYATPKDIADALREISCWRGRAREQATA